MEDLLAEIRASLDAGHCYVALMATLSVPDICASLAAPDRKTDGARYAAWFDANLPSYADPNSVVPITGKDIYKFRCSLLHEGSAFTHAGANYTRILFTERNPNMHRIALALGSERVVQLHVGRFCQDVTFAANAWFVQAVTDPVVQANFAFFARRWPAGLDPYIVGTPVYG